jgi:pyruvate/2-oxoglutarate dehydrogenase complex dihydrolipoamide dehydrogenase (E3) component
VEGLRLEAANVRYDSLTGIKVSSQMQTSNSNIYAAGDCCSEYKFTHMADAMARIGATSQAIPTQSAEKESV